MDRISTECLQQRHIIRFLLLNDRATLIQINKHVASVALPHIYSDPFQRSFHAEQGSRALSKAMSTLGPGIFSWALQEKKDTDSCNNQELSPLLGKQDYERLLLLRHGLVPLKDVELEEYNTAPLTDELDAIVFVLSRTLTKLSIYIPPDRRRRPGIVPHSNSLCQFLTGVIHLGKQNTGQTDLLALKTLNIHPSADDRLALGPGFLAHYPKVNSTTLQDTTFDYQPREVVRQRCFPAWLRRAKVLVLSGWPALTLHPNTLYATRHLDDLRLSTEPGLVNSVLFHTSPS